MSSSNLPWISSDIPPDLRQFLERVRETLSGNEYVRRADYLGGTIPRNPTDPPDPMPTPPPPRACGAAVTPTTPTGLQVAAGFSGFLLSWDMPGYCGHSHTEVYGLRRDGQSTELTVRNMLGESAGVMYSHVVDRPEDYWCFWIKHVNVEDVEGPFVGAPVCAKTAVNPKVLIDALKKQITEKELFHSLGERINKIDLPGSGLIYQVQQLEDQFGEFAQVTTELSVESGSRAKVFVQDTAPPNPIAGYALVLGDLWYRINPADATNATLSTWTGAAWSSPPTRTDVVVWRQTANPGTSGHTLGDLWYDTGNGTAYYWSSTAWELLMKAYTQAIVVEQNRTQIGYCGDEVSPGVYATTAHPNKADCETAGNTWFEGLPWATAVQQVGITVPAYCLVDGKVDTAITDPTPCASAGGTWNAAGTVYLQEAMAAQQKTNGELYAQYSVKIDQDGYVAGFGLSSEQTDGTVFSEFMVRADRFSIATPTTPGVAVSSMPLVLAGSPTSRYAINTATAHGLADGDLFSLRGVTADPGLTTAWNKVWTVETVTSTTRFTFQADATLDTTPGVANASIAKTDVPFIVTTTPSYRYGPATLLLTSYEIAQMTMAYDLMITLTLVAGGSVGPVTCVLPVNGSDTVGGTLTATMIENVVNSDATLSPYINATVNAGFNRLELIARDPDAIQTITARWSASLVKTADRSVEMTIPPGVYIDSLYVNHAVIDWAQINHATIDWLTVVRQLKANNILAGNIGVGNCIGSPDYVAGTSGWRICANGNSEFNDILARGNMQSVLWNGAYDSTGHITTPGTTGWVITKAGEAEFDTVHLRSGAVSTHGYSEDLTGVAIAGVSQWIVGTVYAVAAKVWYGTKANIYWCTDAHTAAVLKEPGNVAYWVPYVDNDNATVAPWSSTATYALGTRVWYHANTGIYISRVSGNSGNTPPTTYDASWIKYTHHRTLDNLTCDMTEADTALGALVHGRFEASMDIDMLGASPLDRIVDTPDLNMRLIYFNATDGRTVLATAGYYIPCVGMTSAGDHRFFTTINDFTRATSAVAVGGRLRLEAANFHGFASVDITANNVALMFVGNKR